MATDFPVTPVDRLPVLADEACIAAILMDMVWAGAPAEGESGDGSRWGIEDAGNNRVGGVGLVDSVVAGSEVVLTTASKQVLMLVAEQCPISDLLLDGGQGNLRLVLQWMWMLLRVKVAQLECCR